MRNDARGPLVVSDDHADAVGHRRSAWRRWERPANDSSNGNRSSAVVPASGSRGEAKGAGVPVDPRQALFDVPETDARPAVQAALDFPQTGAAVLNGDDERARRRRPAVRCAREGKRRPPAGERRDAVLDGVLHQRLDQQRGRMSAECRAAGMSIVTDRRSSNRACSISRYAITSAARRRGSTSRHPSGGRGAAAPSSRNSVVRARSGAASDEMTDRRQRVEQKVRVDLRPQRPELRFGRQSPDVLFAKGLLMAFLLDADGVHAAREQLGHRLQHRDVVGQQPPAAAQIAHENRESRPIGRGNGDVRR